MEDFVTWVDTSKLKRTIMRYNDEVRSKTFADIHHVTNSPLHSWTTSTCYNVFTQICFLRRFIYGIQGHIFSEPSSSTSSHVLYTRSTITQLSTYPLDDFAAVPDEVPGNIN